MVKQIQSPEIQAGLPPMDESWWEAVMAEDEAKNAAILSRKSAQAGNGAGVANPQRANHKRTPPELPAVDWSKAIDIYECDQLVTLQVTSYNRGGLLVAGDGLQGFVPVSHLLEAPAEVGESSDVPIREDWLAGYLNQALCLKIIECDPERGRVVFCSAQLWQNQARVTLCCTVCGRATVSGVPSPMSLISASLLTWVAWKAWCMYLKYPGGACITPPTLSLLAKRCRCM